MTRYDRILAIDTIITKLRVGTGGSVGTWELAWALQAIQEDMIERYAIYDSSANYTRDLINSAENIGFVANVTVRRIEELTPPEAEP